MTRPNKEQLREVILKGNPDLDYRILLNKNGLFELTTDLCDTRTKEYVDRTGTLDRGDGWFGEEAAKDEAWINQAYKWLLPSWIKYLQGKRVAQGIAEISLEPIEKFEREIDLIMKEKRYW